MTLATPGAISGKTTLVGVFGWPVAHSLSPPMHNAAYAAMGLDWVYVPFPVKPEAIEPAIHGARALGAKGVNLTIPHKQLILPLLDEIEDLARRVGAVNTVRIEADGALSGHNTDVYGFTEALREVGQSTAGRRVALIGAGGVGRAMAFGAAQGEPARLSILNRTTAKAEALAEELRDAFPGLAAVGLPLEGDAARAAVAEAELVANATSSGMKAGDAAPVPIEWLADGAFVYDTIYNVETQLVAGARARGLDTLDGASMLVHQGARAIEIWSGQSPDPTVMLQALRAASAANN